MACRRRFGWTAATIAPACHWQAQPRAPRLESEIEVVTMRGIPMSQRDADAASLPPVAFEGGRSVIDARIRAVNQTRHSGGTVILFRTFVTACLVVAAGMSAFAQPPGAPLTLASQGSFFVGGRDIHSETLSTVDGRSPTGTVTVNQVYVRYQIPAGPPGLPIVLVHGCCLTGQTWETTPDGRMGWDEYFLRKGHGVYAIDQAGRGRSAIDPSAINGVKLGKNDRDQLPHLFFVSHEEAWVRFRFGPEHPKPFPGSSSQWKPRPSSGSRPSRTGSNRCLHRIRRCRPCPNWPSA